MVFIQKLRTRVRSCISLVHILNSLIVKRFICYAKTNYDKDLAKEKDKDVAKG